MTSAKHHQLKATIVNDSSLTNNHLYKYFEYIGISPEGIEQHFGCCYKRELIDINFVFCIRKTKALNEMYCLVMRKRLKQAAAANVYQSVGRLMTLQKKVFDGLLLQVIGGFFLQEPNLIAFLKTKCGRKE
ncbi:CLUMA_CG002814, isoform A [Clunio marinus]|uniref:CLUMA_CG002814, isoform A n=1 Tax=Clunio marinus TaxID=568069 RepID=A0A1J1HLD0_9DIPT|nr:CLUMA_CG002814, isoform A [Clunio marinus]